MTNRERGISGALYPTGQGGPSAPHDGYARVGQCAAISGLCWLRMAIAAKMLCTGVDGPAKFYASRNAGLF